jgi:TPR repeat protein
MHEDGIGVEIDLQKAAELYQAAAEKGEVKSKFKLVRMFLDGVGVERDDSEAVRLLTELAKHHPEASHQLGDLTLRGQGVDQDEDKAFSLFNKAALLGFAPSMYRAGLMTIQGEGTPADKAAGKTLIEKAARKEHPEALHRLGGMWLEGFDADPDIEKALDSFLKAAELGHAPSQLKSGKMLYYGDNGVAIDIDEGLKWLTLAADQGLAEAIELVDKLRTT